MRKILSRYWLFADGIRKYGWYAVLAFFVSYLANGLLRPLLQQNLIDAMIGHKTYVEALAIAFVCSYAAKEALLSVGDFKSGRFQSEQARKLRMISFESLLRQSMKFFNVNKAGSFIAKNKRLISSGEEIYEQVSSSALFVTIQMIGILSVVALTISKYMFFGYLFWIVVFVIITTTTFKRRLALGYAEAELESKVTARFADTIANMSTVKLFGAHAREKSNYQSILTRHYEAFLRSWNFANTQNALQRFCTSGIHATSLFVSMWLWRKGAFTPGQTVLVMAFSSNLSESLWTFGSGLRKLTRAIGDAGEMIDIIDMRSELVNAPGAISNPAIDQSKASIRFRNMSFSYLPGKPIFEDFNLDIKPGEKVAIIGKTGSGKTTLSKLLLREMDPTEGDIWIGDYCIRTDITMDGIKKIALGVSQNVELFHRPLRENIAYGKPDASDEEIHDACKRAGIHDFILTLPYGYDSKVGERGTLLSGGEKQRIAIARVFLCNPLIMILDEATSALDNMKEREIQRVIESGFDSKTIVVIAHRLSTIQKCDRIIVLDKGKIIQDGNHDALILDRDGIYYKMLTSPEVAAEEEVLLDS
ncbi:MAG: transporter [Patescibacteria group bacterium]|nr:transporter [Patescibacteria group bacterium]